MREAMSLLLATSILGLGGLGLYFCKDTQKGGDNYDEDEILNEEYYTNNDVDDNLDEVYEVKPKKRGGKTKRSKKLLGTKRRY